MNKINLTCSKEEIMNTNNNNHNRANITMHGLNSSVLEYSDENIVRTPIQHSDMKFLN